MIIVRFFKFKEGKISKESFAEYESDEWIHIQDAKQRSQYILEVDYPDLKENEYVMQCTELLNLSLKQILLDAELRCNYDRISLQ